MAKTRANEEDSLKVYFWTELIVLNEFKKKKQQKLNNKKINTKCGAFLLLFFRRVRESRLIPCIDTNEGEWNFFCEQC